MTAEAITRKDAIAWLNGLAAKDRLEPIEIGGLINMALALVDQPTRLAAARAEGYREGVEAAIADAVAVSIRDEVDSYEMRDDGGGGYSPTDDERIMLEDFGAGLVAVFEQRLRALTPPPAEPAQPDDGWIEWKGGECPVPDGIDTEVRYGDGVICRTAHPAGQAGWDWRSSRYLAWACIIAYRLVPHTPAPAEPSAPVAEGE